MYVVTMHRWGERRSHNYVIGAWPTIGAALMHGAMEEQNRGGKYDARITRCKAGHRGELRREMFNPHRGQMSRFLLRLSLNRAMSWYARGDYERFGGL
jgi:hypothetical protein